MTNHDTRRLTTKRLVLSSLIEVTQQHVDWLNDPDVVRFSENRHKHHSLTTQTAHVARLHDDNTFCWLITITGGRDIGTISAYHDLPNKITEMGILIGDKTAWRQGYGLEAWQAVMAYLFTSDIRKVEAGCMADNHAMRRIMLKSGMTLEGVQIDHFLRDGVPEHCLLFGRSKS